MAGADLLEEQSWIYDGYIACYLHYFLHRRVERAEISWERLDPLKL